MPRTFATFALAALTATATISHAQKIAPPSTGPLVSYQYWPSQYIQFVTGAELPLSMFILEVDTTGRQPLYHAILTDKGGARTHYSNSDALAAMYKAQGEPSYKVDFAVESDDSEKVGATLTARFTAHDEKPVEFRFVQGSDISEQGGGLQPIPKSPIPVFAYRELGALAGEGTALKIGSTVSTAEVWTEYAHPPYFVPYRGAVTSSAHQIVLPRMTETWTVAKYPAALTAGSTWEMDNDRGNHLSMKIEKVDGAKYTLSATDRFHAANRIVVEATRTADAWTTDRVLYMPAVKGGDKHAVAFTFAPGLSNTATAGTLDIAVAKKQKVATATLTESGDASDRTTAVTFTAPAWAANKPLTEEAKITGDTAILSAK